MQNSMLSLASAVVLTACGGSGAGADVAAPGSSTSVYRYAGSVQCEGGGLSLTESQRQLTDAGIQVLSAACGIDGNAYPTVCGAPDGRIRIFEVPNAQSQLASAIGFEPLSNLPSPSQADCQ